MGSKLTERHRTPPHRTSSVTKTQQVTTLSQRGNRALLAIAPCAKPAFINPLLGMLSAHTLTSLNIVRHGLMEGSKGR